jgi:single-strand DNA-binding protein
MASKNIAIVVGNLGDDPQLRHTGSGTPVCSLSVATNERWKDKDGKQQSQTDWHRIVVWGARATSAAKYLKKGSGVMIEGKMRTRKWKDKDGVERQTTEVIANDVQFLDKNPNARRQEEVPEDVENFMNDDAGDGGVLPGFDDGAAARTF